MTAQVRPLKKYGQIFLRNKYFAEKIVDSLNCMGDDIILEIGPGKGALTELLLQKSHKKLLVVEIDKRLSHQLAEKFPSGLTIIEDNILNLSFRQVAEKNKIKLIGNIPYYITSDIIFKIIDNYEYIKCAVLMVQKEVANRLIAPIKTKDYGILTILAGFHAKVSHLFNITRENFYPVPNVDSSVVRFDFDEPENRNFDYELFKRIVKTGFKYRRKMLRNSLKKMDISHDLKHISSISLDKRPEELSIEDFKLLTNEMSKGI
jgi:16S rRNA (adenine1518-N6/adenine1519-N6)-dimethyltransferase